MAAMQLSPLTSSNSLLSGKKANKLLQLPHILMNSDAKIYSSKNNFQSLIVRKILDTLKGDNNPLLRLIDEDDGRTESIHCRVLDIGSADGASTALIHDTLNDATKGLAVETVGLDILPTMVDFASHRYAKPGLSFKVGNIGDLQNLTRDWTNSFDLILSFNCMHWLEDQVQALKNVASLLKPKTGWYHCVLVGEQVGVMIYALDKMFELHDAVIQGTNLAIDPDVADLMIHIDDYIVMLKKLDTDHKFPWKRPYMTTENPAQTYKNYMEQAGFTDVRVIPLPNLRFVCLPSKQYMNLVHTSFFPHLNEIKSPELRKRFIELLNTFCFEYNLKSHSSEVNHMSPEFYVVGRGKD